MRFRPPVRRSLSPSVALAGSWKTQIVFPNCASASQRWPFFLRDWHFFVNGRHYSTLLVGLSKRAPPRLCGSRIRAGTLGTVAYEKITVPMYRRRCERCGHGWRAEELPSGAQDASRLIGIGPGKEQISGSGKRISLYLFVQP